MSSEYGNDLMRSMFWPQSRMFKSAMAMTRATMTAFGAPSTDRDGQSRSTEPAVEAGEDRPAWETEQSVADPADIGVGDEVQFTKPIGDDDVRRFAAASGDTNPIHLDADAAGETRFGERIAHGTLVGGLISAALARLPGTVVYLSQDLEFLAPVDIESELTATCRIVEDLGDGRFRLSTVVAKDGETCIDGEAVVLIES
jgi:acyl dehydratase